MKKLITLILSLMLICACALTAACAPAVELVSVDATDLLQEDFGIAVKKGDTAALEAVNAVVDEWNENGNMDKYLDYYTTYYDDNTTAAPEGLKVEWNVTGTNGTLTVYTESGFAPYEYISNNTVVGLDIAIASQVAENLGYTLVVKDVLFDTIISSLNTDTSDMALAAAGLTIDEERAAEVDFSNVYSSSTLSIVSDKTKSYSSLSSLTNLKIGVQEGTSGDLIATAAVSADGYTFTNEDEEEVNVKISAEVVTYKTYAAALAALKSGKIDVIFMDKLPSLLLIANA